MGKSKDLATLATNGLTTLKATNLEADIIKNSSGTSALSINSSGVITKDVVPAWRVCLTSSQVINASGNTGTGYDVVWNDTTTANANYVQGGCTLSSGVITVPVTGLYQCNAITRFDGVSSGYIVMRIVKNNNTTDKAEMYVITGGPNSSYENLTGGDVYSCTAGDTLKVTVAASDDTTWDIDHNGSKFSGFLIG